MAVPNIFTSGTLAKASEVNENFTYVDDRITNENKLFLIASQTLASTATNINFASIASGYKKFVLECSLKMHSDASGAVDLEFNSDTGSNYYVSYVNVDSANNISGRTSTAAVLHLLDTVNVTASTGLQSAHIQINNSTLATGFSHHVSIQSINQSTLTSNPESSNVNAHWEDNTEISNIKIKLASGNFAVGSVATLWGMK